MLNCSLLVFGCDQLPAPGTWTNPNPPIKIADLSTVVPGESAPSFFSSFGATVAMPGDPCFSANNLVFTGVDINFHQGLYLVFPSGPSTVCAPSDPCRLVDAFSVIPGTTTPFSTFSSFALDGSNLAFVGGGNVCTSVDVCNPVTNLQGVYTMSWQAACPCTPTTAPTMRGDRFPRADLHFCTPSKDLVDLAADVRVLRVYGRICRLS